MRTAAAKRRHLCPKKFLVARAKLPGRYATTVHALGALALVQQVQNLEHDSRNVAKPLLCALIFSTAPASSGSRAS